MKPTCLVIEDNPYLGELYEIAFTAAGFEVLIESQGRSGQNLALTWKPQLIILDIMMPDLDGLSILRNIAAKLPETKIVCCSNLNQEKFRDDALALGAALVLDKSQFTPMEIVGEIEKNFDDLNTSH